MSAFTKLLAGAAPLPAEYRGVVVAKPLEALPIGGLGAGPPPHPLHWAETLRPIGATTPLVLTAKQAAGVRDPKLLLARSIDPGVRDIGVEGVEPVPGHVAFGGYLLGSV